MTTFPAPRRITIILDSLQARPELASCDITLEECPSNGPFPSLDYDTARVFVRWGKYSVNVHGVLQDGVFQYRAMGYHEDNSPWGPEWLHASLAEQDKVVDFVVQKFASVMPKVV